MPRFEVLTDMLGHPLRIAWYTCALIEAMRAQVYHMIAPFRLLEDQSPWEFTLTTPDKARHRAVAVAHSSRLSLIQKMNVHHGYLN